MELCVGLPFIDIIRIELIQFENQIMKDSDQILVPFISKRHIMWHAHKFACYGSITKILVCYMWFSLQGAHYYVDYGKLYLIEICEWWIRIYVGFGRIPLNFCKNNLSGPPRFSVYVNTVMCIFTVILHVYEAVNSCFDWSV